MAFSIRDTGKIKRRHALPQTSSEALVESNKATSFLRIRKPHHVYQRRCWLLGQAAVLHTPQPGGPGGRKGTLETPRHDTLETPRHEKGRTFGRDLRRRLRHQHERAPPRRTDQPDRLTSQRERGGITPTSGLASPGGAPPAGFLALSRAPPPPPGLFALARASPPELPGPGTHAGSSDSESEITRA